eukprot:m.21074 g.21074  ORF g.21074 m.21074 type:complete len:358 (+) comp3855_c0_seq1:52-1125(+)
MMRATSVIGAALLGLAATTPESAAHSSLLNPFPRNAVDKNLPQWSNGRFGDGLHCAHPANEKKDGICWGCNCTNGTSPCNVGQTCVWFSQGCSIGCKTCDGLESNPNTVDRCNSGMKPTNNDPKYRTYNRNVTAMSPQDIYQHNPWRAPGSAPVYDACGMAGGGPHWIPTQLSYRNTSNAVQGDLGSKVLPHAPTGIVWKRGDSVEATWSLRANHGGGYQYRLCPLESNLTEACFQSTPIPFAGQTWLMWNDGSRLAINGTFLSQGTLPPNSTWAMNPLPFSDAHTAVQFQPPCNETVDRTQNDTGHCSGRFPYDVSIVDLLKVPEDIAPGPYVLGFRYDCEATAQVWSSCADIVIA